MSALHPYVQLLHARLRRELGLTPDTRLDHLILGDGTTYEMQPDGVLKCVHGDPGEPEA